MITDYHTHTFRCGHATGTLDEYVDAAIAKGIDEIGLTDHLYLYFEDDLSRRNPGWAMPETDFDEHYREMLEIRDRYSGRITVRISVEADYIEGRERDLERILGSYEFDYVLGSVHFMAGWLMDDPEQVHRYGEQAIVEVYRRYYARLRKAIRTGFFDLIAHFDLPKKFGHFPEEDPGDILASTLDAAKEMNVALELSSAGLRKPVGEIYPAPSILTNAQQLGIPISLSSDAHAPHEVGSAYDTLLREARAAGYSELATFDGRTRVMQPMG